MEIVYEKPKFFMKNWNFWQKWKFFKERSKFSPTVEFLMKINNFAENIIFNEKS